MKKYISLLLLINLITINLAVASADDEIDSKDILKWCQSNPSLTIEHIEIGKYSWSGDVEYVRNFKTDDITDVTSKPKQGDKKAPLDLNLALDGIPLGDKVYYLYNNLQFLGLLGLTKE